MIYHKTSYYIVISISHIGLKHTTNFYWYNNFILIILPSLLRQCTWPSHDASLHNISYILLVAHICAHFTSILNIIFHVDAMKSIWIFSFEALTYSLGAQITIIHISFLFFWSYIHVFTFFIVIDVFIVCQNHILFIFQYTLSLISVHIYNLIFMSFNSKLYN